MQALGHYPVECAETSVYDVPAPVSLASAELRRTRDRVGRKRLARWYSWQSLDDERRDRWRASLGGSVHESGAHRLVGQNR